MSYFDNKLDDLIPELSVEVRKYSQNPQLSQFLKNKINISKQARSFSINEQPKKQNICSMEFSPQQRNKNQNLKKFYSYNPDYQPKQSGNYNSISFSQNQKNQGQNLGQNQFYSPQKQRSIQIDEQIQFSSPTQKQKLINLSKMDTLSTNLPSTQFSNQNLYSQQSTKNHLYQEKLSPLKLTDIRKQRYQQEQIVGKMAQQLHKICVDNQKLEKFSKLNKYKEFYEWDLQNRKNQERQQKQKTKEQLQKEKNELQERVQREKQQNKMGLIEAQQNFVNQRNNEISQEKEHRFQIKQIGQMNRIIDYQQRKASYMQVVQQHNQLKNQKQYIQELQKMDAENNYKEKIMREQLKQQELERNIAYLEMDQQFASQQLQEAQMESQADIKNYYIETKQGFNVETSSLQGFMKNTSKPTPINKLKNIGALKNQEKYSKFVSDPTIMSPTLESKKVI